MSKYTFLFIHKFLQNKTNAVNGNSQVKESIAVEEQLIYKRILSHLKHKKYLLFQKSRFVSNIIGMKN